MKRACVVGWPVEHSRSPMIHSYWLEKYGIDGVYEKVAVRPEEAEGFFSRLADNGFAGCNVTVPLKEIAIGAAEVVEPTAEAVGAANTLWIENGALHAANTDTYGFMAHLEASVPGWREGCVPAASGAGAALVIGAGGAARAIVHGFIEAGVAVEVCNRTLDRANALVRHFGPNAAIRACPWENRQRLAERAGLIVNTTTIGMKGEGDLGLDVACVRPDCIVADIVYVPLETKLLADARAAGLRTVDGLGMLLHQAVPGFEKWFGVRPEVTGELRDLIVADLEAA